MRYGRLVVYRRWSTPTSSRAGCGQRAGGRPNLVVQAGAGEPVATFIMRAGPAPTPVSVTAGGFSFDAELAAGEERELAIPLSPAGTALVSILAGRGFRPSDVDPSSADRRLLGVRLEPKR